MQVRALRGRLPTSATSGLAPDRAHVQDCDRCGEAVGLAELLDSWAADAEEAADLGCTHEVKQGLAGHLTRPLPAFHSRRP
jgi:hypothetical protein